MRILQRFLPLIFALCLFLSAPHLVVAQCVNKIDGKSPCTSVNTAIGPISTDPAGAVTSIMGILLSLSGGIALLLIIGAGYQLVASQGNPEKVKEARERLTSAIVGLLFTILSVSILQIIGIQVLQLPGFSK